MANNAKVLKKINEGKVIVNLDKIGADTHIVSVVFDEDVRNGSIAKLGEYLGQDVYKAEKCSVGEAIEGDSIVFVAPSILEYDEKIKEEDVVFKAGTRLRAYVLRKGEIVSITEDGLDGTIAVNKFVVPQSASFVGKIEDAKSKAELNFKVIAKETLFGYPCAVLQVL